MILPVDPTRYATFLGVMAVMAVTPGPANVFAIAIGAERGKRAALIAVAGMNSATLVWFGVAALGLGAAALAFPQAFHLIAYAGAAYVAWLGLKSLLAARIETLGELKPASIQPGAHAWRDGFAVQISNPKAILFFTAVLPPFLDPNRPLPPLPQGLKPIAVYLLHPLITPLRAFFADDQTKNARKGVMSGVAWIRSTQTALILGGCSRFVLTGKKPRRTSGAGRCVFWESIPAFATSVGG